MTEPALPGDDAGPSLALIDPDCQVESEGEAIFP